MTPRRQLREASGRCGPARPTPEVCLAPRRLAVCRPARAAHQPEPAPRRGHHGHPRAIRAFRIAPRGSTPPPPRFEQPIPACPAPESNTELPQPTRSRGGASLRAGCGSPAVCSTACHIGRHCRGYSVRDHGSVRFASSACPLTRWNTYEPRQKRPKIRAPSATSNTASSDHARPRRPDSRPHPIASMKVPAMTWAKRRGLGAGPTAGRFPGFATRRL